MAIEVKVFSSSNKRKVSNKRKPQILTNKYVRELNKRIAYNILKNEAMEASTYEEQRQRVRIYR